MDRMGLKYRHIELKSSGKPKIESQKRSLIQEHQKLKASIIAALLSDVLAAARDIVVVVAFGVLFGLVVLYFLK